MNTPNLEKQVSRPLIEIVPHLINLYLIITNYHKTMKNDMHVYEHQGLKEKFWP